VLRGKKYVVEADDTLNQRDQLMCTTFCPCDVENWDKWTQKDDSFSEANLVKDDEGVDDWSDCEERIGLNENYASAFKTYFDGILEILEEDFNCQGICSHGRFFLFREVDEGPVEDYCLIKLKKDFTTASMGASVVLIITLFIDFLLFVCMFGMMKDPN
jgi:hypothetical protein